MGCARRQTAGRAWAEAGGSESGGASRGSFAALFRQCARRRSAIRRLVAVYQIDFTTIHSYSSEREGISVPVVLKAGENSVRLAASIDTGATFCIFRNELADVRSGPGERDLEALPDCEQQ